MIKKISYCFLSALLMFSMFFYKIEVQTLLANEKGIEVIVNGKTLTFDQAPEIIDNRVLVPMRPIFEALGYSVEWVPAEKEIIAKKTTATDETIVQMRINERRMHVEHIQGENHQENQHWNQHWNQNEQQHRNQHWNQDENQHWNQNDNVNDRHIQLDVAPMIIDGNTMVPVRAISEATGYNVNWDSTNKKVIIN